MRSQSDLLDSKYDRNSVAPEALSRAAWAMASTSTRSFFLAVGSADDEVSSSTLVRVFPSGGLRLDRTEFATGDPKTTLDWIEVEARLESVRHQVEIQNKMKEHCNEQGNK
jgi:hypothetical protein